MVTEITQSREFEVQDLGVGLVTRKWGGFMCTHFPNPQLERKRRRFLLTRSLLLVAVFFLPPRRCCLNSKVKPPRPYRHRPLFTIPIFDFTSATAAPFLPHFVTFTSASSAAATPVKKKFLKETWDGVDEENVITDRMGTSFNRNIGSDLKYEITFQEMRMIQLTRVLLTGSSSPYIDFCIRSTSSSPQFNCSTDTFSL
ncbi:hypothetical protein L6452_37133 [Arctium lappa]|uniref:Uncharacterized protein n=1 Tax=Arctium lappa TaxID=4217 RepID=A0ACB8Y1I1_ARCLA|nr:hypothetical protein L6452_37133 [Arctium lappa]